MKRSLTVAALIGLLAGCRSHEARATLTIAAAADLNFAMEEVSKEFRKEYPAIELKVVYGSSGNFYSQIQNHAPFDLFLSADVEYPRRLAQEQLAAADSLFVYAVGRLVVWVPANSSLDPATALTADSVRHVAIANPQHAPYGKAAVAALHSLGVFDSVEGKLVMGENVAQTLQFAESGAADVGIVALSLAIAPSVRDRGRYWRVPLGNYPKVEQGGIILKESAAARELRSWLLAPRGRAILERYGFYLPEK
jgi:molybdate transport system substrate-binding protein